MKKLFLTFALSMAACAAACAVDYVMFRYGVDTFGYQVSGGNVVVTSATTTTTTIPPKVVTGTALVYGFPIDATYPYVGEYGGQHVWSGRKDDGPTMYIWFHPTWGPPYRWYIGLATNQEVNYVQDVPSETSPNGTYASGQPGYEGVPVVSDP